MSQIYDRSFEELLTYVEKLSVDERNQHQSIVNILSELLETLGCDRAWCLYPCDPEVSTWGIPAEITRPQWGGVNKSGLNMPSRKGDADIIKKCLDSNAPVTFGKECDYPLPEHLEGIFLIKSQMATVIYPQQGQPWLLGVHYCENYHLFIDDERAFFGALAKKMGETFESNVMNNQV